MEIINEKNWETAKVAGIVKIQCDTAVDMDAKKAEDLTRSKVEFVFDCSVKDIIDKAIKSEIVSIQSTWRRNGLKGIPIPKEYRHTFGTRLKSVDSLTALKERIWAHTATEEDREMIKRMIEELGT